MRRRGGRMELASWVNVTPVTLFPSSVCVTASPISM